MNRTENQGSSDIIWLQKEIDKRNAEIAKKWEKIAEIQRVQAENNEMLRNTAAHQKKLEEEINELKEGNERISAEIKQIKRGEITPNADETEKVINAITGFVLVTLIVGGIAYAFLRS